jgi:transposase-like protein
MTPAKRDAILSAYRRGEKVCDIAARFGVHPTTVSFTARRAGERSRTALLSAWKWGLLRSGETAPRP